MTKFNQLRQEFPEFVYKGFTTLKTDSELKIKYDFEIVGLASFSPEWTFPCPEGSRDIAPDLLDNLAFSLGMVELISYWKATCSSTVRVLPHTLDNSAIEWWKALYFGGLGEFFYTNGIKTDEKSFMNIITSGTDIHPSTPQALSGNLVPVGGGKDSAVTLHILKRDTDNLPYVINSRGATDMTCEVAGYKDSAYRVKRTIDKNLLELNKKGFLNGHTPFSALVAFSSLIAASINGKKHVVLSNESSANESTVLGEEINHQFSKGVEFEKNFISYQKRYINCGVEYFSLLRPLSEMQIAALFAKYKEYHSVFRSCNAGSKTDIWCCNCPKCLFVYIILSPFIQQDDLVGIFGENLFEKRELLETYKELLGVLPNKPFECVGSRDEVVTASAKAVELIKEKGSELPYLLDYFEKNVHASHKDMSEYMSFFDSDNCLPDRFVNLLKTELKEYIFNV